MISGLEEIYKRAEKLIGEGYVVLSAYSIGKNVNDIKTNWHINLAKENDFVSISKNGVRKDKPMSVGSGTDLKAFDDDVYKYLEDAIANTRFSIKTIYLSVSEKGITISLFSDVLKVRKIVIDPKGKVLSDEEKNLIGR